MKKIIGLLFLLQVGFTACKTAKNKVSKLEIAKRYYKGLDSSNSFELAAILSDSLVIRESEYDYQETFSLNTYMEWLQWDSVFSPSYKILEIKQQNNVVKAKISKYDKRISFLHEIPIVTNETIRFKNNKIRCVEKTKYLIFNENVFLKNRSAFLDWVVKTHPELKEVIYDQTKLGAKNYLKLIKLYNAKK